jgi:type II secretory pathway pseudopilin PulG
MMASTRRSGFTIREVLILMAAFAILAALFLPNVRNASEAARRMSCSSNIRNIGLAALNYESTYRVLPGAGCGIYLANESEGWERIPTGSEGAWSGFSALAPYLEASALYDQIVSGYDSRAVNAKGSSCGPWGFDFRQPSKRPIDYIDPREPMYLPARTQFLLMRCPSDPSRSSASAGNALARTNYAFCFGDAIRGVNTIEYEKDAVSINDVSHSRGAFCLGLQYPLAAILDGTSNTIAFGEIATPEKDTHDVAKPYKDARFQGMVTTSVPWEPDPLKGMSIAACASTVRGNRYTGTVSLHAFRGVGWLDGRIAFTGFNTILPPNSPSCAPSGIGNESEGGIFSASGYHLFGAHVVMLDCAVRFITDDIDSGKPDADAPGRFQIDNEWHQTENWLMPSPFGVWGALGTRSAGESLDTMTDY